MPERERALEKLARSMVLAALSLLTMVAIAGQPVKPSDQQSDTKLNTVTVEGQRQTLKRQVSAFVSAIAVAPYNETLARWENPSLICPLVAGLPGYDGEFILTRLSSIASAAGAPLGPASCKPNFYVIVTSQPDELLKAWDQRDTNMFGEEGSTKIRRFLHAPIPIRVWYNATLNTSEGVPLGVVSEGPLGGAPSILQLFSASGHLPPPALSPWDQAFIKALYHTEHTDPGQLGEIEISVVKGLTP